MPWTERPPAFAGGLPGAAAFELLLDKADAISLVQADCTGALTVSTTLTDITGCTATVTVVGTTSVALVVGSFDFSKTAVATLVEGLLDVDGVSQTGRATFSDGIDAGSDRVSVSRTWLKTLATGSHVIKLRAQRTGATGTVNANVTNTCLLVALFDFQ